MKSITSTSSNSSTKYNTLSPLSPSNARKTVHLFCWLWQTTYQTELGQLLDLLTAPEDTVDLSKFSLEKHSFIVTYKTAFYTFYLPVALAMYMAEISDEADLKQAKDVLIPLGEYFQIQVPDPLVTWLFTFANDLGVFSPVCSTGFGCRHWFGLPFLGSISGFGG
jgi:Polyprenyl synthetase